VRDRSQIHFGQSHRSSQRNTRAWNPDAQAVQHHDPDQGFDIGGVARLAKDAAQFAKAEFFHNSVSIQTSPKARADSNEIDGVDGASPKGSRRHFEQAADNGIQLAAELFEPTEGGDGALFDPACVIPIGLDELDVAALSGGGDLDKHAATLSANFSTSIKPLLTMACHHTDF